MSQKYANFYKKVMDMVNQGGQLDAEKLAQLSLDCGIPPTK
jgi:hypothetical protein